MFQAAHFIPATTAPRTPPISAAVRCAIAPVRASVRIERTPQEVLALVADPRNDVRWRERVSAVELVDGTAGAVGARYLQRMRIRGAQVESEVELLEVRAGSLARFRILRPVAGEGEYRVAAAGAGAELELVIDLPARPGLAGIADRMIAEAVGRGAREDLAALRALMEAEEG